METTDDGHDLFGAVPTAATTTTKLNAKMARAITKLREEKAKTKEKLSSFAEVVQAVAAFDRNGRIQLDFDKDDDQYDISGLQQHDQQLDKFEATLRDAPGTESQHGVPVMNICIMIVGTRGDVQPFLGIAKRLQQDGHRVRLATHAVYREFVTEHGVEFYPLGGDPKELAAYMVKTGGHLIPLKYENITQDVPKNIKMLEEILNSTWPAVTAADPDALGKGKPGEPFQAQAIISNPVTYGHVHVAERLGVPLHIMFPQPWVPTVAFPHPLSNMPYDNKPQKRNYMSYKLVDLLMWQGTESMVNEFRTEVLGLRKIRKGDGGRDILLDLAIPHAFMWSSALVPKPADWGGIYDVIGTVLLKEAGSKYTPTPELEAFLGNDGGPIFVGFGSMVIEDPAATTKMIIEAAKRANNVRVLIQSSWSDMSGGLDVPDNIFFLGNCPHDWLMPRVCAVVHHGGAGTTAAGLLAGKPTFIVPFFGDQPFWGRAVVNAGVGHEPCPITQLTVDKLHAAFVAMQSPEMRKQALRLKKIMESEDGVEEAVKAFYRHLPLKVMRCEVCETHLATKWSEKDRIRLCKECEYVITSRPENSIDDIRDYQCVDYSARGPDSTLEGVASGAGAFLHELGSGVKDVFIKPAQGYREQGATGAVIGLTKGVVKGLFIRPIQGVVIFADHVATGHHNKNRAADERKVGSVFLDNKRLRDAVGMNTAPDAHRATMRPDERTYEKRNPEQTDRVAIQLSPEEKQQLARKFQELVAQHDAAGSEDFSIVTSSQSTFVGSDAALQQSIAQAESLFPSAEAKVVPKLNICLLTTGTWTESVQQFVAIGIRLKADGHRVRIATNENFRNRVTNAGLEFYPLGGHASTVGKFLTYLYDRQSQKRGLFGISKSFDDFPEVEDLRSLVFSLWPACVSADPLSPGLQYRADLIVSHPFVFGQTIVAERLGVPLHCISNTPLSRTQGFPHLLSLGAKYKFPYHYAPTNVATFDAIDSLLYNGLHDILDDFRSSVGLLHSMSKHNLLADWHIPHTYLWNANLVPKPNDWGSEICVAGHIEPPQEDASATIDHTVVMQHVQSFVAADTAPVIYFGFVRGDWDSVRIEKLVQDIEQAAIATRVRVVFQTVEAAETASLYRSSVVLEVPAAMPAQALVAIVASAVHWGDGSTTSSWLRAGVPSAVVARNATQRLWGQAIACSGVGADPLDVTMLTPPNLTTMFQQLLSTTVSENAKRVAKTFSSELAIETAVQHIYNMLPVQGMCCDVDPTRVARIYDTEHELKLSYEAHLAAQSTETDPKAKPTQFLKYKPLKYSLKHPPRFSLRQLDHHENSGKSRELRRSHFSYEVTERAEAASLSHGLSGLSLTKKGLLSRIQSVAVNVIEAPVTWKSGEVMEKRVAEIHAAYEKLLAQRAST